MTGKSIALCSGMNLLPIVTGWFPWTVDNERLGVEELCQGVLPVKERGKPEGRGAHLAMSLPAQQGVGSKDCPIEGPHVGQNSWTLGTLHRPRCGPLQEA